MILIDNYVFCEMNNRIEQAKHHILENLYNVIIINRLNVPLHGWINSEIVNRDTLAFRKKENLR